MRLPKGKKTHTPNYSHSQLPPSAVSSPPAQPPAPERAGELARDAKLAPAAPSGSSLPEQPRTRVLSLVLTPQELRANDFELDDPSFLRTRPDRELARRLGEEAAGPALPLSAATVAPAELRDPPLFGLDCEMVPHPSPTPARDSCMCLILSSFPAPEVLTTAGSQLARVTLVSQRAGAGRVCVSMHVGEIEPRLALLVFPRRWTSASKCCWTSWCSRPLPSSTT
jgi:hypothetical protein